LHRDLKFSLYPIVKRLASKPALEWLYLLMRKIEAKSLIAEQSVGEIFFFAVFFAQSDRGGG
jgi:hypothetical protein